MGDGNDLNWTIKNGELSEVVALVSKDSSLVKKDCNGRPPLCVAADYGHEKIIEYLANQGADVNAKDKYGISPLLSAIYEGHSKCVKMLLDKGASKEGTGPDGKTYLESAESDDIKMLLK